VLGAVGTTPSTRPARRGGAALPFDILALDGEVLRRLPFSLRKPNLARLLSRRPDDIFVAPFEQSEIRSDLFEAACRMRLKARCRNVGIVPIAPDGRVEGLGQCEEPETPSDASSKERFLMMAVVMATPMPIRARCAFNGCKNESVRSVDHRLSSVLCGVTHL